ncbi:hypothetical protein [Changpingibacter yushuensis]|uniref:hypothetical protein n=1 Tax=Changpingibacter yushuensis TaxID=2758440 RepID=UPI00165E25D7|nr:hypothetical protein [Changpingibacter yushuensis]
MSILITESAREGFFAQWDPYNNGGIELAALPNAALLSPLSLPWWILPAAMAPAGVKLLEIAAIGVGFHLLLRRQWHLPAVTAPLATLIYVASGFMVAVDALAVRRQWRYVLSVGVVVASMLLGGFPAVTAYALYCAAIWFVVRSILIPSPWKQKVIGVGKAAASLLLAFCISAVQVLPFVWFTLHNVDFESRAEIVGIRCPPSPWPQRWFHFSSGLPTGVMAHGPSISWKVSPTSVLPRLCS